MRFFEEKSVVTEKKIHPSMSRNEMLAITLGYLLRERIHKSEEFPNNATLTEFNAVSVPSIKIEEYLLRFMKYFKPNNHNMYIIMLIYLDYYFAMQPLVSLNHLNVHRLMASSLVLAAKFHSDYFFKNSMNAKIAGITTKEMNALERTFYGSSGLNYQLYIEEKLYDKYLNGVIDTMNELGGNSVKC